MKTSKRLLSILLMLTMLLSMFTVMASADTLEDPCMHADEEGNTTFTIFHAAATATCYQEGHVAYYECKTCHAEAIWSESEGRFVVQTNGVPKAKDPANHGGKLHKTPAQEPTCGASGNYEYYYCSGCNKYFKDEDGQIPFNGDVVRPATGKHTLVKVDAKDETCTEDGYEAYWKCSVCKKMFSGEAGETEISAPKAIKALDHKIVPESGKAATCTEKGIKDHYACARCGAEFADADGKTPFTDKEIPAAGHQLTKTNEVPATCTKDGTKAYWTCSVCKKMFSDENGTTEIQTPETIAATGHKWGAWKKNADGTKETRECSVCHTKEERTIAKEYDVTVKVNNSKRGQVNYIHDGTTTEDISKIAAVKGQDIKLKAVSADSDKYKFGYWVVTGVSGLTTKQLKNETLTFTMPAKAVTVKAVFILKPVDDDYDWLELDIGSHGSVEFKDDGTWTDVDDGEYLPLERGETYKFRADPDSGYKTVWQLDDGSKYTGNTFSFKMGRYDSVLHVYFVSKSSTVEDDYPTLTFDITGGKHGTVYRGTREYEHGDVISIKKNDKMTFKAKADKGYVAVWTYKGESYVGDEFTVKMGATDAKLYVEFMDKDDIRLTELPFRDVSKRDWYYDDVVYVYRKGYMDGMSSTRFGGELNTTRGQIVTILWRLTGEPRATKRNPFTDVSSSQYYYDAISWAYDAGVVDGFDARTFKPDQNVTREQLAAILYRYAEYMNLSTSGSAYLAKYRDADKIANWAYDAMAWANYRGLINGTSATRIDPKGYATRAQIAAILHRFAVEYGA